MWIVAIAWMYVAVMMAVVEATSPQGSLLGAFFTLLLYGLAPVALVMYLLGTPARRRARRAREAAEAAEAATHEELQQEQASARPDGMATPGPAPDPAVHAPTVSGSAGPRPTSVSSTPPKASGPQPDAGGLAAGAAVPPEGKEAG